MTFDVAVLGLGPAGRALTHRLVEAGASVLAIDPHPDRPWRPTYGGWRHQLPGWLGDDVVGATSDRTDLIARNRHRVSGQYAVLDNDALQHRLDLSGTTVRAEFVTPGQHLDARVVVDCRGNLRGATAGVPVQTAHGLKLPRGAGEQLLGDAEAVLMDWRPVDGSDSWGDRRPSFCYVIPLPDGRVLAEETCLAGRPPIDRTELAHRLGVRLTRADIDPRHWRGAEVERVHIPMLAPDPEYRNSFGAAGDELNPITGYSVFASLAAADEAARALLAEPARLPSPSPAKRWPSLSRPHHWRRIALGALLQLDGDNTLELFEAFGRLPAHAQRAVLDPHAGQADLLVALGRQWSRMPRPAQRALVAATTRGVAKAGERTR